MHGTTTTTTTVPSNSPASENTCELCEMPLVAGDHATSRHHAARAAHADAYLAYCAAHGLDPAGCGWNDVNNFIYRTFNQEFVPKAGSGVKKLKVFNSKINFNNRSSKPQNFFSEKKKLMSALKKFKAKIVLPA